MNSDVTLNEIREALTEIEEEGNQFSSASDAWVFWQDAAEGLASLVAQLDSHLSAGGTPPEPWSEGPDEPHTDDPEPDPNYEVVTFQWSTRFGRCLDCGRPAAFWLPRAYRKDDEPDDVIRDATKRCSVCAANAAVYGDGPVRRISDDADDPQRNPYRIGVDEVPR